MRGLGGCDGLKGPRLDAAALRLGAWAGAGLRPLPSAWGPSPRTFPSSPSASSLWTGFPPAPPDTAWQSLHTRPVLGPVGLASGAPKAWSAAGPGAEAPPREDARRCVSREGGFGSLS